MQRSVRYPAHHVFFLPTFQSPFKILKVSNVKKFQITSNILIRMIEKESTDITESISDFYARDYVHLKRLILVGNKNRTPRRYSKYILEVSSTCLRSQPSRSGEKKVYIRSSYVSSGILKGSSLMFLQKKKSCEKKGMKMCPCEQ
jgi:hypothetical protein